MVTRVRMMPDAEGEKKDEDKLRFSLDIEVDMWNSEDTARLGRVFAAALTEEQVNQLVCGRRLEFGGTID